MKYIDEIKLTGKRVLIRLDLNVPLDKLGTITDDTRIIAAKPTIEYALDEGAKIIIISHLGRPKGKRVEELSLAPVAKRLSRILKRSVSFIGDCLGSEVEEAIAKMEKGDIILLENLRFYPEETKNDDDFARKLASFADVYVDDAFGNAHRSHASNIAITKFAPTSVAGFLIKKELTYFQQALENPKRPFVAIIGGSKVSGKLEALLNLLSKVDKILVGGAMAFTFLKARGYFVGASLVEDALLEKAQEVMTMAKERGVKFYLPIDVVIAQSADAKADTAVVPTQEMRAGWAGYDIGPATVLLYEEALNNAGTIVWNGPLGVFEAEPFSYGTMEIAHCVASSTAISIVGGGDTDVAIHKAGESENISFISTGGGASLELLAGKTLPAIVALG
ncbi:MAG: phosphoglycerate kinase [Deltaproteobacteria bacterium]|nr:phosphoglycerate kinase [Deltaproteobacteria bacterium]